jgi:alpha,alpha-trehalose-phosphate synthase [UDP-forming]
VVARSRRRAGRRGTAASSLVRSAGSAAGSTGSRPDESPEPKRAAKTPRQLVIVSNRLPVQRQNSGTDGRTGRWVRSVGGLVTAMEPVLAGREGIWIGWNGNTGGTSRPFEVDRLTLHPVPLGEREIEGYYNQMSNRTLWPLYHDAIREPEFDHTSWRPYVEVNRRFARAAAKATPAGGTVWVHDYHLQLVPAMLRAWRSDVKIGFFLHIPFPPAELFAWLPWRERVLQGLLGADVVGFQTYAAAQNFSRLARQYTVAEGTDTQLQYQGRSVYVNSFPISIDFNAFERAASQPKARTEAAKIRHMVGASRKIVLGVDRLDYTKGIDSRLLAYELLLKSGRVKSERCAFIQIAVPSRELALEYAEMRTRIEQIVGRINGEFSEPGRVAVHYFRRGLSRDELVAYYLAADVMVVTPLRDGMNLVSKEFLATRTDGSGVLVLSEFAGAARELRRALVVNPRDLEGTAGAIHAALTIDTEDAHHRMVLLRQQVRRHDVHDWAESFLRAVEEP